MFSNHSEHLDTVSHLKHQARERIAEGRAPSSGHVNIYTSGRRNRQRRQRNRREIRRGWRLRGQERRGSRGQVRN